MKNASILWRFTALCKVVTGPPVMKKPGEELLSGFAFSPAFHQMAPLRRTRVAVGGPLRQRV